MKNLEFEKIYLQRAWKVARLLQFFPYVKMICLTGSLSKGKTKPESDIDFFIVLEKNRLWLGRIIVTFVVQLSGLRRYGAKIAGRICLNRYQTEDYLKVSPGTVANAEHFSYIYPLWWHDNLWQNFEKSNNWITEFGFSFKNKTITQNKLFLNLGIIISFPFYFLLELLFGNWGEELAKKYQIKRIMTDPLTTSSPDGAIYISNQELRFHPRKTPF